MINITMSKEDSKLLRSVLMKYCGDNRPVGKYGGPLLKTYPVTEEEWERLGKLIDVLRDNKKQ